MFNEKINLPSILPSIIFHKISDYYSYRECSPNLLRSHRVFTTKREKQYQQNSATSGCLLHYLCEQIEGVFNEAQNTGRNLEIFFRKMTSGFFSDLAANMPSYTLRILLYQRFGIHFLIFEQTAN